MAALGMNINHPFMQNPYLQNPFLANPAVAGMWGPQFAGKGVPSIWTNNNPKQMQAHEEEEVTKLFSNA